jgi:hypothetical protein
VNEESSASIQVERAGANGGRPGHCIGFARFFFFVPIAAAHARMGKPSANAIDTGMKTFDEWLAERQQQCEGLWLNDKNAVIGLSKMNPLPGDSAVNKSLSKKPKPPPSGVPVFQPCQACSTDTVAARQTGTACEDRGRSRDSTRLISHVADEGLTLSTRSRDEYSPNDGYGSQLPDTSASVCRVDFVPAKKSSSSMSMTPSGLKM